MTRQRVRNDGRPRSRMYEEAARVAKRFEPPIADRFLAMVARIQRRLDAAGLAAGQTVADPIAPVDEALTRTLRGAAVAAGEASTATLVREIGGSVAFDATDPATVTFARQQAGRLIVDVLDGVRRGAAEVVAFGAEFGLTTREMSSLIFKTVGVAPNMTAAPGRLADAIRRGALSEIDGRRLSATDLAQIRSRIAQGTVDEAFIATMQRRYADSLRRYRANMIARTEALTASHHGQRVSWRQAIDANLLPANARRVWIVTPDDRLSEEHARIPAMNPTGVGIDEPFTTPEGEFLLPPTRPNCRCGVGLTFPGRAGVL